jgi:hypothetical protein
MPPNEDKSHEKPTVHLGSPRVGRLSKLGALLVETGDASRNFRKGSGLRIHFLRNTDRTRPNRLFAPFTVGLP